MQDAKSGTTIMERDILDTIRTRLDATRERAGSWAALTAKRAAITSAVLLTTGVLPAAAQVGETSENLCGTGLEILVALIASIIIIGGFVIGTFEGGAGFIKYDNPDPQVSKAGENRIKSGVVSIIGPPMFFLIVAAALEFTDYAIASCFVPDLGLFGTITMAGLLWVGR